jgi:RNA polymerase sigma factor (sigma-70 family)
MSLQDDQMSRLAKTYLPLVETIALEYNNTPNASHDELVSEGRMALLRAACSFDPARGNFISYASAAIRNRLNDLYEKQVRRAEAFPVSIGLQRGVFHLAKRDRTANLDLCIQKYSCLIEIHRALILVWTLS